MSRNRCRCAFGGNRYFFQNSKQRISFTRKSRTKNQYHLFRVIDSWIKMSEKLNAIRDQALAACFAEFDERISQSVESFKETDISDEDIRIVKDKYRNAYVNYFTTAFNIAFQKDLVAKLKENQASQEEEQSVEVIEDDLNLSVTDEDLQKLDDANTYVAIYRKNKPAKCSLLLEKTLKLQFDAVNKIKVNVKGVPSIDSAEAEVTPNEFSLELNQEYSKLREEIRDELEKLRRFETAAQILSGNQQEEEQNHVTVQETTANHDQKNDSIQA